VCVVMHSTTNLNSEVHFCCTEFYLILSWTLLSWTLESCEKTCVKKLQLLIAIIIILWKELLKKSHLCLK